MAEITVARWVAEDGRRTRKWHWAVRLGGKQRSAGIALSKDAAWQHGVESLALIAYQLGMADALDDAGEPDASPEAVA